MEDETGRPTTAPYLYKHSRMDTPKTREFAEQFHKSPLHVTHLSFSTRSVTRVEEVDGWYYLDGSGLHGLALVRDCLDYLLVTTYACSSVGKRYNLPPKTMGVGDHNSVVGRKLGGRRYHFPALDDAVYVFDPSVGTLTLDLSVPGSLVCATTSTRPRVWVRLGNEDERLWSYSHRLEDISSRFNDPQTFLEFAYNYYLSGTLTGFGIRGSGTTDERLNALGHEYSQVRRSYGGRTRGEYEEIYRRLSTVGILRRYGVKRLVHWPQPGTYTGPSASTIKAMQWCVNQQRYNMLGVVLSVPNEGGDNFALLCPGERVVMRGSGTRLDGIPLRLAMSGWHTGPKPDKTHIPDWMHENWSYYTLRLPWIITNGNNTIYYREENSDIDVPFSVPPGTYYLGEVLDAIGSHPSVFHAVVDDYSSRFHLFAHQGIVVNSPHRRLNPSTLFGPTGFNIGYLWGTRDTLTADADCRVLVTPASVDPLSKYNYYTPLTGNELNLLHSNMAKISIEAQHGPVYSSMAYDNLVACLLELSVAASCESGNLLVPYTRVGDSGMDELYTEYHNFSGEPAGSARSMSIRLFDGHPGERRDTYGAGACRPRLGWMATDSLEEGCGILFYKQGDEILVDGESYSLAGRAIEHTIVNALDNPKWLITYPDPSTGKATIDLLPYPLHENSFSPNPTKVMDPRVVEGEWLVGTVKESWVRRALNLPSPSSKVPRMGYVTHYSMTCSLSGSYEEEVWHDPRVARLGIPSFLMGKILRYFNSFEVQHIIVDPRSSVGGTPDVWHALAEHCGADRRWNTTTIIPQNHFDPTGIDRYLDSATVTAHSERVHQPGRYKYIQSAQECSPSRLATVFQPLEMFGGPPPTVIPGLSTARNIVWITTSNASMASQMACQALRGCSVPIITEDGRQVQTFDGNWGDNVQFITYGSFTKTASTTRIDDPLTDWYARGRKGEEEISHPPVLSLGRGELTRSGRISGNSVTAADQSFSRMEEPNIVWDADSNVFFQDIGYTLPATFDTSVYRHPWLPQRHQDVNFLDTRTWRDSVLDKCIRIAADPNVSSHFFRRDGYGKLTN